MKHKRDFESYFRALRRGVLSYVRSCGDRGATPGEVARDMKADGPTVLKAMQACKREGDLDFDPAEQRVGQAVWRARRAEGVAQ